MHSAGDEGCVVAGRKLSQAAGLVVSLALTKGSRMLTRFGTAIALLLGVAFSHQAFADTIKGESHDRKMTGTQKGGGGGGAGKTQSKPKQKMLNPQPEQPGRR